MQRAVLYFRGQGGEDSDLATVGQCAAIHLLHCLQTSIITNTQGRHSTALCLVRQCVEALAVVDAALQEPGLRGQLLSGWREGALSPGALRSELERHAWPRYGSGLWHERWSAFFSDLARAVQPYAHYTRALQEWQYAMVTGLQPDESTGDYRFIAQVGPQTYDAMRASRMTVLHCLVGWTTGRVLAANGALPEDQRQRIHDLGAELARCEYLCGGALSWPDELWPHMFWTER
jgi:hypothetical protein